MDIVEYNAQWKQNANAVEVDVTIDVDGKEWCRKRLDRYDWSFDTYSDKNVFLFKDHDISEMFRTDFAQNVL